MNNSATRKEKKYFVNDTKFMKIILYRLVKYEQLYIFINRIQLTFVRYMYIAMEINNRYEY